VREEGISPIVTREATRFPPRGLRPLENFARATRIGGPIQLSIASRWLEPDDLTGADKFTSS
jgi:hypothetical protein